ncbi:hypothetical protein [Micromonospora lupini]|uniref:EfeO-type cupredoxin-like domain-containing protein n=1 Tax=Micromonospora lupini str. Lupac 08 TaxID=1150864 RepID=I0L5U7_9ACTN|nr:hypothetical protein [Micromonospora lupini]CCH19194.1 Conserved exported hypothetical protein [Micromonospora lupini str. Lupac 08]
MFVRAPGARRTAIPTTLLVTGLLSALLTAGCGHDDDPSVATPSTPPTSAAAPTTAAAPASADSPTAAATASTPAVDREITVTVTKRRINPPTGRVTVAKGQLVRITVTSDVVDELHVHGYDLGARLPAGTPGSVQFRAEKTGLFEVETHETELVLFQLVVR